MIRTFEVQTEDGKTHEVDVDDGVEEVKPSTSPASFQEAQGVIQSNKPLISKLFEGLKVPAEMSQRGLEGISEAVKPNPEITGNLPRDLVMNYPSVSAKVLSQVAPGFIDRASILTAGAAKGLQAAKPAVAAVGRGIASQLESLSGAVPDAISEAFKDPTLLGAPGKKAAQKLYETAKNSVGGGYRQAFKEIPDKKSLVDASFQAAKDGSLTPAEALEARKTLDSVKKQVSAPYFNEVRAKFDGIAKQAFEKGDEAYKRAVKAESLRQVFPQNKYGGTSAFKLAIMAGLKNLAENGGVSKLAADAIGLGMSPLAMGTAATGAGIATRAAEPVLTNPAAAVTVKELIKRLLMSNGQKQGTGS